MLRRFALLLSLALILAGCAGTPNKTFAEKYGNPVRLVVTPANAWLDAPGSLTHVETYIVTEINNRVFVDAKYTAQPEGIVTVTRTDEGKLDIKALQDGMTTYFFTHQIGAKSFQASLTVNVLPDIITVGGFNRSPIFEMRSSLVNFTQTSAEVGGRDGVADFFVHGDKIYSVSSDLATGDTVEIFDKRQLNSLKKFTYFPRRYMQKLILLSPERGILIPQLPDTNNEENILLIDLQTGAVVEKIQIANNTGFDLWLADAAIHNDRMFISTTPFDNNAWAFRQCYVIVLDLTNMQVVDTDLSDPAIDFITLPFENPRRLFIEDDGDLLVMCAGNDLSTPKTEAAVLVYDTNSFKLKDTQQIGSDGYLGVAPAMDKTGRLYLADQYRPNVFSFDTKTDKLTRNMTNGLYFPPPQAIGFADAVVVNEVLYLTNPYGYLVQAIDISGDDDAANLPYNWYLKMNTSFTHIESRRDKNSPTFVTKIVNPQDLPMGSSQNKVLGSPEGAGVIASSTDVIEIGDSAIIFGFDRKCVNEPGADFVIFSAAKYRSAGKPQDFDAASWRDMTPAKVSVSIDGENWVEFSATEKSSFNIHNPRRYEGCWAGINPTIANMTNNFYAEFTCAGGDRFDLAHIGLNEIRYIKIEGKGCKVDAIALLNNVAD